MTLTRHAACAVTTLVMAGAALSGQSPNARATFDAADIFLRPRSVNAVPAMTAPMLRGTRYDLRSATVLDVIKTAYGLDKEKILGGPSWIDWNRFDIVAKAPAATPP